MGWWGGEVEWWWGGGYQLSSTNYQLSIYDFSIYDCIGGFSIYDFSIYDCI